MVTEADLAKTRVALSYELDPAENIAGDLSGIIGEFCENFVGAFYPRSVSRKANVVVTELFTNAVTHNDIGTSSIRVRMAIDAGTMIVQVQNEATAEQCARVRARVRQLHSADDPRAVLARTIRERHADRLAGGLGLMRLVAENKFELRASCRKGVLTVAATIDLGGLS